MSDPQSVPPQAAAPDNSSSTAGGGHNKRKASLSFILVAVFIDMLGVGLIVPVLPLLVGKYAGNPEQQAHWYGILVAVFGLMQFLCMPVLGALSDRYGRRPVLFFSMAGMCINFLTTAWASSLAMLFIGRVIGGMSSASMSVATAYVSDISTPEQRAASFGKIGAAFGVGFICGPMLGGMLGNIDLHLPFYVAAALAGANLLYGVLMVPESLDKAHRASFDLSRLNPFKTLYGLTKRKDMLGLLYVFILASFGQLMIQSTWVLYTSLRFQWDALANGMALFCVGLSTALVQALLLPWLIKRMGEVRLSLWGLGSGALISFAYGFATEGWMMYALILCNILAIAAGPALQAISSKMTDPREQGSLMGSLQAMNSLGMIIMPLVGTSILAKVSHLPVNDWKIGASFYVCGVMQVLAWWLAVRFFRQRAK